MKPSSQKNDWAEYNTFSCTVKTVKKIELRQQFGKNTADTIFIEYQNDKCENKCPVPFLNCYKSRATYRLVAHRDLLGALLRKCIYRRLYRLCFTSQPLDCLKLPLLLKYWADNLPALLVVDVDVIDLLLGQQLLLDHLRLLRAVGYWLERDEVTLVEVMRRSSRHNLHWNVANGIFLNLKATFLDNYRLKFNHVIVNIVPPWNIPAIYLWVMSTKYSVVCPVVIRQLKK